MRPRVFSWLLILVLAVGLLPGPAQAAGGETARGAADNGQPYAIMVNRRMSTVTVYTTDENGLYTVPVRAMVCSTGAPSTQTPRGNFSIGKKHRWNLMMGGVYAQYLSQFYRDCLFHSVCYSKPSSSAVLPGYYDGLGAPASHGCIRLQTEDAKWIYDNCGEGTLVTIYDDDDPGELGKPAKMIDSLRAKGSRGWDPTDPLPENPWAELWTRDISLSADSLCLTPGETSVLTVARSPEGTTYPTVMYRTDTPSVAVVDGAGSIRATGMGKAVITVSCGEVERSCVVYVTDTKLPFCDVPPDAWFYQDVQYLYEKGLISGGSGCAYAPDDALARVEALQLLYNIAGKPPVRHDGTESRPWYADAVEWASIAGLTDDAETPEEAPVEIAADGEAAIAAEALPAGEAATAEATQVESGPAAARLSEDGAAEENAGDPTWDAPEQIAKEEEPAQPAEADEALKETLTRGELVELLYRYNSLLAAKQEPNVVAQSSNLWLISQYETGNASRRRSSQDEAEPPETAAAWALRTGLLLGEAEGNPSLNTPITRAQAAALLHRYCEKQ